MNRIDPSGLVPNLAEITCIDPFQPVCWGGVLVDIGTSLLVSAAIVGALTTAGDTPTEECKDDKHDCDKEWQEARRVCRDLIYEQMLQQAGRRKKRSVAGVTGGYTDVEECARGLVSERCGGNKVVR